MPRLKRGSFGSVNFSWLSPKRISQETIAIGIPFKEALHLNLAIQQCLAKLSRYNMATRKGKNAAVRLNIYGKNKRIMVLENG